MSKNWSTQHKDNDTVVKVKTGSDATVDHRSGRTSYSEFIVQDRNTGEHIHLGLDEYGEEVFRSRDIRK